MTATVFSSPRPLPIGQFLCSVGLVIQEDVDAATRAQQDTGEGLVVTLVRQNALDVKDAAVTLMVQKGLRDVLARHGAPDTPAAGLPLPDCLRLGEILLARGEVLREDIERALQRCKETARRLGDVLVSMGAITARCLAGALHLQKRLVMAALLAGVGFATALAPVPAEAATASATAKMQISVTIQKSAKVKVKHHPHSFQISREDIARGYVDLTQHSLLEIQSNSRDGFALEFHSTDTDGVIRELNVRAGAKDMRMDAAGGMLILPGVNQPGVPQIAELSYRVYLTQGALPGTYAWPFRLAAMAV